MSNYCSLKTQYSSSSYMNSEDFSLKSLKSHNCSSNYKNSCIPSDKKLKQNPVKNNKNNTEYMAGSKKLNKSKNQNSDSEFELKFEKIKPKNTQSKKKINDSDDENSKKTKSKKKVDDSDDENSKKTKSKKKVSNKRETDSGSKKSNKTKIGPDSKLCRKCNIVFPKTQFSKHGGTADKLDNRCKACVKAVKNNPNRQKLTQRKLDTIETDPESTEWQGGKIPGSIFKRDKYIICAVDGKQKSFAISHYKNEKEAREAADKYRIKKAKEDGLISNQYKIIHDSDDAPKWVFVQISKNKSKEDDEDNDDEKISYVTIIDYDDLEKIKELSLCENKSGNKNAKIYCTTYKTKTEQLKLLHQFVLGARSLVDHVNRIPLDNRKENLRKATLSENNRNRTGTDTMTGIRLVDNGVQARYKKNNEEFSKTFKKADYDNNLDAAIEAAKEWRTRKIEGLGENEILPTEDVIKSQKRLKKLLKKHAPGFSMEIPD